MARNYISYINRRMGVQNHGSRKEIRPLEEKCWNLPQNYNLSLIIAITHQDNKTTCLCGSYDSFQFAIPLCQAQPRAFRIKEIQDRKMGRMQK